MRVLCSRPFVDLDLEGPAGSARACTGVDTGGGAFFITGELGHALGVSWELQPDDGEGAFGKIELPPRVTNLPVEPLAARTLVKPGSLFEPGYPATAFFPAHLMLGREVLFDYPGGVFDLAPEGSMDSAAERLPAPRSSGMGFPRVELEIDGERLGFLLDTGASYTMVSDALLARWSERHPDWPVAFGASRHASMGQASTDLQRMIRVPKVRWGASVLSGVGMVGRPEGTFERYMSGMMTAPIVGALAGNVLRCFRFQLGQDVVFTQQIAEVDSHDLDGVGLALNVANDGRFAVVGVCDAADDSVKSGVETGDVLLAVDGSEVSGRLCHDVFALLADSAGETLALTLQRGQKDLTVEVTTASILHQT